MNTSTGEASNKAVGKRASDGINERLEILSPSWPQQSLMQNNIGRTFFQKANYMIVGMVLNLGSVRLHGVPKSPPPSLLRTWLFPHQRKSVVNASHMLLQLGPSLTETLKLTHCPDKRSVARHE